MKVTIDIPQNNYKPQTEVREYVLRALLIRFVETASWGEQWGVLKVKPCDRIYLDDGQDWQKDYINKGKGRELWVGFCPYHVGEQNDYTRVRKCEMDAAFAALAKGGYLLYSEFDGTHYRYKWSCKPLDNRKRDYHCRFESNID